MKEQVIRCVCIRMFDANIAGEFGLEEAVFLFCLREQLQETLTLKKKQPLAGDGKELIVVNGRPWIPKTLLEFCGDFPFWTIKQIRRIIASCKRQGAIETNTYGASPLDRRLWYTLKGGSVDEW